MFFFKYSFYSGCHLFDRHIFCLHHHHFEKVFRVLLNKFSCTSKQIYINYKVLKAYLRPSSIANPPPLPRGSCGGITPFTSLTYIQFSIIITFFYRIDICDNAAAAQLSGSLLRPPFFHHVSCCRRKHNQQVQKT